MLNSFHLTHANFSVKVNPVGLMHRSSAERTSISDSETNSNNVLFPRRVSEVLTRWSASLELQRWDATAKFV